MRGHQNGKCGCSLHVVERKLLQFMPKNKKLDHSHAREGCRATTNLERQAHNQPCCKVNKLFTWRPPAAWNHLLLDLPRWLHCYVLHVNVASTAFDEVMSALFSWRVSRLTCQTQSPMSAGAIAATLTNSPRRDFTSATIKPSDYAPHSKASHQLPIYSGSYGMCVGAQKCRAHRRRSTQRGPDSDVTPLHSGTNDAGCTGRLEMQYIVAHVADAQSLGYFLPLECTRRGCANTVALDGVGPLFMRWNRTDFFVTVASTATIEASSAV